MRQKVVDKFDSAIAQEICAELEAGLPLLEILVRKDMPSYRAVMHWKKRNAEFAKDFEFARENGYLLQMERLTTEAFAPLRGIDAKERSLDLAHRKLKIDTIKYMASKLAPRVFSDKQKLEIDSTAPLITVINYAKLQKEEKPVFEDTELLESD